MLTCDIHDVRVPDLCGTGRSCSGFTEVSGGVHKMKNSRLQLHVDSWESVGEYSVGVLKGAVAGEKANGGFEEVRSETFVTYQPRRSRSRSTAGRGLQGGSWVKIQQLNISRSRVRLRENFFHEKRTLWTGGSLAKNMICSPVRWKNREGPPVTNFRPNRRRP